MFLSNTIKLLLILLMVLMSIMFLTLYERKILGYTQIRKGPNKLGLKGILQPISDAIKLFNKSPTFLIFSSLTYYTLSPSIMLTLAIILWVIYPSSYGFLETNISLVFFMMVLSLSIYPILGASYFVNSLYSLLGGLRAIAQTISYEVSLSFILLSLVLSFESFTLSDCMWDKQSILLSIIFPLLVVMWFIVILAETSRTPFDFTEGESELVSGFNTEFSGSFFSLFFLAEYSMILLFSYVSIYMFFMGNTTNLFSSLPQMMMEIKVGFLLGGFIWVRATLPRLRYDKLMSLAWKQILLGSLGHLTFCVGLYFYAKS